MKTSLHRFFLLLMTIVGFWGCLTTSEYDGFFEPEILHFSPEGGEQTVVYYSMNSRKPIKIDPIWEPTRLITIDDASDELNSKKHPLTPTLTAEGVSTLEGDWVKFIYPKNKRTVKIVVQPNKTSKVRHACLTVKSESIYSATIYIVQWSEASPK